MDRNKKKSAKKILDHFDRLSNRLETEPLEVVQEFKLEQLREAEQLVNQQVAHRRLKAAYLKRYACALAATGKWEQAESVAQSIENNQEMYLKALVSIAEKLALAGFIERAESLIDSMPHKPYILFGKVRTLLIIAGHLIKIIQFERANQILGIAELILRRKRESSHVLANLFEKLAENYFKLKHYKKAQRLWGKAAKIALNCIEKENTPNAIDVDAIKSLIYITQKLVEIKAFNQAQLIVRKTQKLINWKSCLQQEHWFFLNI